MTFDEIRARYPSFGFALYAMIPGGPVTFEVHDPDGVNVFSFEADTEQAVLERAFGSDQPPEETAKASPATPSLLEIDLDASTPLAANIASIFD